VSRQLAFDLPVREALGREDFLVSPANALAVEALERWRDWPQRRMLLVGPEGSGKSHLTHVWAAESGARVLAGRDIASLDLTRIAAGSALALEDGDRLAGDRLAEEALFHLHNLLGAQGGALMITATHPVRNWGLTLPDLASRMQALAVTRLEPPDDALLSAVLVKQFSDRQISVTPALIAYLVQRMDRSLAAARSLVAALDAASLAEGRPVTRTLAAALLDRPDPPR
jgi:chromosomal replication initiation ATPase DnaA